MKCPSAVIPSTLILILFLLTGCPRTGSEAWLKPNRVVNVQADVRKSLIIASSSSVLAKYGPLAGVLAELMPIDMKELTTETTNVDWTRERCIWTFDATVDEVSPRNSILIIRATPRPGSGIKFWFFDKAKIPRVTQIQFE
jgi:hypothetical protein